MTQSETVEARASSFVGRFAAAARAVDRLLMRLVMAAAATLLVAAACISMWQVITRFAFQDPATWTEVTARALIIWMVYLGLAVAVRTGALMCVEYLYTRCHGRHRAILVCVIAGVTLGVLLVMVVAGYDMAHRVRFQSLAGIVDPVFGERISISWLYAAVPVGAVLSLFGLLGRTIDQLIDATREDG